MKNIFKISILTSAILMASVTSAQVTSNQASTSIPQPKPVVVQKEDQMIRGLIIANSDALLSSPMAGRLSGFNLKPGQRFAKGQVILNFECDEHQARSSMAQAELDVSLETQQAKMRMQGLSQASELEVKMAAANVAKAEAGLKVNTVITNNCKLRAPFDGKVSKINVKPYQGVQMGQPLVEFLSDRNLNVKINAPAKLVNKLKMGDVVNIKVDETEKTYQANIVAMNAKIDAVSQTFEIEARVKAPIDGLLPGMSGNITFDTK